MGGNMKHNDSFASVFHGLSQVKQVMATVFKDQKIKLFVTNIDSEPMSQDKQYCLIFERHKIEIVIRSDISKLNYCLDLQTWDFLINDEEKSLGELDGFIEKIQWVLTELENCRATAYIESYRGIKGEL